MIVITIYELFEYLNILDTAIEFVEENFDIEENEVIELLISLLLLEEKLLNIIEQHNIK